MKKSIKRFTKLSTLFFLLCIGNYVSEQTEVSGIVKDRSGIAFPGVNIPIKGSNAGTT